MCIKYYSLGTSEISYRRGYEEGGLSQEVPMGSCSVTVRYQILSLSLPPALPLHPFPLYPSSFLFTSLSLTPLVFLASSPSSLFHPCPAISLPLLLLAQSPAGSPLSSPPFSLSTSPRSVQVFKSLHVDKIIKYLTESFLSSFPEPLETEPRASHRMVPHRADKMEFI